MSLADRLQRGRVGTDIGIKLMWLRVIYIFVSPCAGGSKAPPRTFYIV